MVKSEGNQYAFDKSVNQSSYISRAFYKSAQRVYGGLNIRPDEEHQHADDGIGHGRDYRNEPRAAEEGYHVGKSYLIKSVVQRRDPESDNDTAENSHLKRFDTDNICDRAFGKRVVLKLSRYDKK